MIQILTGGAVAFFVALLGTPVAMRVLVRKGYGQLIRDDGPTSHLTKRGTPTMGGTVMILAVLIGYAVAHLVTWTAPTASGLLAVGLMTGLGFVGFLDDYIKVFKQRSLGLRSAQKLALQATVSIVWAVLAIQFPDENGVTPASRAVSIVRDTPWVLPAALFIVWACFIIAAASNGVNLTDGLDGLAAGASAITFGAYTIIGLWHVNQACSIEQAAGCYEVRNPLDLSVVSLALVGACIGFLWWNASPAKIFMGDTGSLALGGAVAALAILTRTEVLLLLLGGLFVVISASVIIQVGYFKLSHGKRVFRMAPLQHHFELLGWKEVTIVIRFWIVALIFTGCGLALFYADWIARS